MLEKKEGEFTFYYENGNVESTGMFHEDKRVGAWKYYNPDETLKTETELPLPRKFVMTEGFEAESSVTFQMYPVLCKISYNGVPRFNPSIRRVYMVVESMAEPVGGVEVLHSFIRKTLVIRPKPADKGLKGL